MTGTLNSGVSSLETATGILNSGVLSIQTVTGILDSGVSSLETATGVLNSGVSSLQANITGLFGATGALSTATGTLNTNISTVSGLITSNDSDIANLNTATGVLTGATGVLSTATGVLNSGVSSLETATGILNSGVSSLETATGLLTGATGLLSIATGNLSSATGVLNSGISSLNTATGLLNVSTGFLSTATGVLNSGVSSLNTVTGILNSDISTVSGLVASSSSDISGLQTATGFFLTSGQINTNINTAVSNLVDSAPSTLNTLNELAAALGDDANFSTTITNSLSNKVNKSETGIFALTGADVTFNNIDASEINLSGGDGYFINNKQIIKLDGNVLKLGDHDGENFVTDIFANGAVPAIRITGTGAVADTFVGIGVTKPESKLHVLGNTKLAGNVEISGNLKPIGDVSGNLQVSGNIIPAQNVSFDLGSASKRFKDLFLSGNSIFLGNAKLGINADEDLEISGSTGVRRFIKNTETGNFLKNTETGNFAPLSLVNAKPNANNPEFTGDNTFFRGNSTFFKTVNIFPPQGRALTARSTDANNSAVTVFIEGPVTVGHDLFKRGGFTDGFADGNNHFHDITIINLIEQAPEGDVKNLERVQERYYAITGNNLPNDNAAFWAWHRVARPISATNVDTTNATLNVTGLQASPNRLADSQKGFQFNTTPSGKSEEITVNLSGHSFASGDNARMIFGQSFEGPIVAASLFGRVVSSGTNSFNIELYGGNYKTTSEVPTGVTQTGLSFQFVTLQTIGTNTIVQNGNEVNLQHYAKTNFAPNRLRNNTVKASWSSAHGLKKNETLMIITDGRGDLSVKQGGYVIDPDPDGDGNSAIIVYGRRVDTVDLSPFTAFGSSNWSIHKGSMDGIHDDTLGDNLLNFNANNVGEYKQYQIGPGCETDADCISIGKNVYNRESGTVKIGYENEMLNVTSNGIDTTGAVTVSGNLGIGTNAPQEKLHVAGDTLLSGNLSVNGDVKFGTGTAIGPLHLFGVGGTNTTLARFENTTSTSADNDANVEIISRGAGESTIHLINKNNTHTGGYQIGFGDAFSEALFFNNFHDNRTDMVITQAGGVGIGTTSVTAGKKLEVNGDVKTANINAGEIDSAGGDGYSMEGAKFAKLDGNLLQLGDWDDQPFQTAIYSNNGIETIRITGGNVGIGTSSPTVKLEVNAGTTNSVAKFISSDDKAVIQIKDNNTDVHLIAKDSKFSVGNSTTDFDKFNVDITNGNTSTSGNLGIGTGAPSAKLHVVGSGIVTSDFAVDTNTLFVDASSSSVGIRTSTPRDLYPLHVNDNFLVTNGNEDHLNINTTAYIYKFGDISGGDNGSFFEINSPMGAASINQAAFGIGVTLPQASLHVNGTATVSGGLTTLGKTTLSSDAFVIETGSFTLGNTHKGATVLLQNSGPINITVPSQVSGYVTTFIAETHNSVSFITGSGMSGLNSFNGASDIAGIYGQAQVIYKSPEYAFLGGNIV